MSEIIVKDKVKIEDMIYEIRGRQVMLDKDLAYFYRTETKIINQVVKRNIQRFPKEFCFKLTSEEIDRISSRSQIVTLNKANNYRGYNIKYLPYAFTEQGVAMLSALLKSDIAIKTSIVIINAFVEMRKFISSELLEDKFYKNLVLKHDNEIKLLKESFSNFKTFSNEIFYEGQIYDAYSLLLDIFSTSRKSIIIMDNYISKELLDILSKTNKDITIYTKNIDNNLIKKYNSQYHNVTIKIHNSFHDRFIIIDKSILYHCGASFKDLGKKCFCISKIDNIDFTRELLSKINC